MLSKIFTGRKPGLERQTRAGVERQPGAIADLKFGVRALDLDRFGLQLEIEIEHRLKRQCRQWRLQCSRHHGLPGESRDIQTETAVGRD